MGFIFEAVSIHCHLTNLDFFYIDLTENNIPRNVPYHIKINNYNILHNIQILNQYEYTIILKSFKKLKKKLKKYKIVLSDFNFKNKYTLYNIEPESYKIIVNHMAKLNDHILNIRNNNKDKNKEDNK